MAKKIFNANDWIKAYKEYALHHGELVNSIKQLIQFKDRSFVDFRKQFEDLGDLELKIIIQYFEKALKSIAKDDNYHELNQKDQHLAFLYLLIENIEEDEIFLEILIKSKSKDGHFILSMQKKLQKLEIDWSRLKGWRPDIVDKLNFNPKQTLFVNHALSCIWFYLKDRSEDKQDTDAFIEKTTDLMFKVTDTSTLQSMLDFGKFMYSRREAAFS